MCAAPRDKCEHLRLLGSPPVKEFFDYVRTRGVGVDGARERALESAWQVASALMLELERNESGCADGASVEKLPVEMAEAASQWLANEGVARAMRGIPHRWGIIKLDELVVHQRWIDLLHVDQLLQTARSLQTPEDKFHFSAGTFGASPEVMVTRVSESLYCFASRSSDIRFLELAQIDLEKKPRFHVAPGIGGASVVGAVVGFGVNAVSACRIRDRLILLNGTHRAYTLLKLGVTQIPCLIQDMSREDDLNLLGGGPDLRQALSVYLGSRPPMLKDFLDNRLSHRLEVWPAVHFVYVQIGAQRSTVCVG